MTVFVIVIIGLLGGIVVNYLSDVLPLKRRFVKPFCVHCYEKQDMVNYFLWPRKCAECSSYRSFRVWIVELLFIGISLWLWFNSPEDIDYYLGMILMFYFGIVVVIDLEHRLILHPVSLSGGILCIGIGWKLHGVLPTLIGGAVGFGLMLGLHFFGNFFTSWLSRRRGDAVTEEALGFGDVNLSGVLGLLLGWPGILAGLVVAILLGGAVSTLYIIIMVLFRRYKLFTAIPYGPFLVASAVYFLFLR